MPVPAEANAANPLEAFAIQLERRAIQRILPGDPNPAKIEPLGLLMRSDLSQAVGTEPPLRLEEEEVPREGVVVQRALQFTRWLGGRRHLWLGRSKQVGRGEGSSGLRFDTADKKPAGA